MQKIKNYTKPVLFTLLAGGIIGFLIAPYMDFNELQKPFLAPPSILFPIAWTILYLLMGLAYGILKDEEQLQISEKSIYILQLIVNLLWPIFFFIAKWRLFSFIWLLLLIFLVMVMIKRFYRKNKVSGLLLIPYILWLFFAGYLNFGIYYLNG